MTHFFLFLGNIRLKAISLANGAEQQKRRIQQPAVNHRTGRFDPEKIPWSENADLKFNASNEKGDGSNKQGEERKSLSEFRMLKYFYEQMEEILDN